MKKVYVLTGLKEVPLMDGYGDEHSYLVNVHIGTFEDINEAEIAAFADCTNFEHGVEIKTAFVKSTPYKKG